jgi:hypothetical protein
VTKNFCIWVSAYILVIWLTAVYHARVYGFGSVDDGVNGVYGSVLWPVYWFVESIRYAAGYI